MAPAKPSKEEERVLANVTETGKCTCGKSIDQADSLISFVIVIEWEVWLGRSTCTQAEMVNSGQEKP